MPKNEVSDPITDQEIAFALLVLSGAMTDRQAAQAVGLNPDSAAFIKSKSQVSAYMLGHRAAVQQQQEADLSRPAVEALRRPNLDREQVLARLWEISHLRPEMTRGSVTGQVKALSLIIAMENFIPNPRAVSSQKNSPTAPAPQIYTALWRRKQQATTSPQQEDSLTVPEPKATPSSAAEPLPDPAPSQSTLASRFTPSEAPEPHAPSASVPDLRAPFSIKINPVVRSR